MTPHSTAFFSSTFSTVSTLFTVLGAFFELVFQLLDMFRGDRIEPLTQASGLGVDSGPSPWQRSRSASDDWPARGHPRTSANSSSVGTSFLGFREAVIRRCRSRSWPHRLAAVR